MGHQERRLKCSMDAEIASMTPLPKANVQVFSQFNDGQVVVGDLPHRQAPGDAKDDQAKTDRRRQTGMVTIQVPFW